MRWISSEISVADSSCAKRSSSIFASISATGCSNSRNVVFMGKSGGPLYASSTSIFDRSVFDRNRVEASPEIPGGDRAPRGPGLSHAAHGAWRHLATLEIVDADGALQPQIGERQHVRAQQVEHQEHL